MGYTGGISFGIDSSPRRHESACHERHVLKSDHSKVSVQYSGHNVFRNGTGPMTVSVDGRGSGFKDGDVVTMSVNVPRREITFSQDGHQVTAKGDEHFFVDRTLHMAVTLTPHSGVQLLDFETSPQASC